MNLINMSQLTGKTGEIEPHDYSDLFIQGHALNADQIEALD